jgi:tetratricopeptide (TPR) repeat protein
MSLQIDAHLAACSHCMSLVQTSQRINAALRDAMTYETMDALAHPSDRWRTLSALDASIRRENEEAKRLLHPHLRTAARFAWGMSRIVRSPRFRTAGVVRTLADAAHEQCVVDAVNARNIADIAITLSGYLQPPQYSLTMLAEIRGRAWKERANALVTLGENRDALEALDRATRFYRELADPRLQLASVSYIRGCVLRAEEQFDDAMQLARDGGETFFDAGEMKQYRKCRRLEATILFERGLFDAARPIIVEELSYGEETGDRFWIALACQFLANIDVEIATADRGRSYAERAIALFSELGQEIFVLLSEWTLARITAAEGKHREAISRLHEIRAEFSRRGMHAEASLAAIDLIQAMRCLDMTADVRRVALELIATVERAGMPRSAVEAAVSIRDAIDRHGLSETLLDRVRAFFRRLDDHPHAALVFIPS